MGSTSVIGVDDLHHCPHRPELVEEEPEMFGRSVAALNGELGIKVLGGRCGTDNRHIECLARKLSGCT